MKYIEKLDNSQSTKVEIAFNKLGIEVVDSKDKVFAKSTESNLGDNKKQNKYYILTYNNMAYDPYGIDGHREKNLNLQLKSTSKATFENYIKYLQTKNSIYLTKTQRNYING